VSSPITLWAFFRRHIAALQEQYAVTVIANIGQDVSLPFDAEVHVIPVMIERKISLLRDLRALICLVDIFRRHSFGVVHSVTPKAGLLAMAAAWLTKVPVRIHVFTGQVWATRTGAARAGLKALDGVIAKLATHVLVDSHSQREFLLANRVVNVSKSTVLANGSTCGADGERFRPDEEARRHTRDILGIPDGAVVFLYLGRLNRDKGLLDLTAAFAVLAAGDPAVHLLVAGPDEEGLRPQVQALLTAFAERVRLVEYTDRPEHFMAAADVLCLPSYREGFPQVAIEAAAAGLPVIASRIYGVTDAVVDGETGLLHPPGDVKALCSRMEALASAPQLRRELGAAGRARVLRDFSQDLVTQTLLAYYACVTRKL